MWYVLANAQSRSEKLDFLKHHWDETHIVVDFDGTLTQFFDAEGKKRYAIISLLYQGGVLDDDYTARAQALHDTYYPIEHDMSLDLETRSQAMEKRWTDHKLLFMEKGLMYKHLQQITSSDQIMMRSGTDTLLHEAERLGLPVVIFSASGVGYDAIKLLLQYWWLDLPNITIVSNKIYRDETGTIKDFSRPVIHSLNKKESVLRDSPEYHLLQEQLLTRPYALVIGDSIGDAGMVEEKPGRVVARIGLCNDKVEEKLPNYLTHFDAVITHDDGFEVVLGELWWEK